MFQATVTFDLAYNAPDGSVGAWPREGLDVGQMEDEGGGCDDDRLLVEKTSDTDSLPSSPSKSFKGSRLSIASKSSQLKSPTRA